MNSSMFNSVFYNQYDFVEPSCAVEHSTLLYPPEVKHISHERLAIDWSKSSRKTNIFGEEDTMNKFPEVFGGSCLREERCCNAFCCTGYHYQCIYVSVCVCVRKLSLTFTNSQVWMLDLAEVGQEVDLKAENMERMHRREGDRQLVRHPLEAGQINLM